MGISMSFGSVIKKFRTKAGLSQVELSSLSGVSLPTIQNIEREHANPSLTTLEAIGQELGLELRFVPEAIDWDYLIKAGLPLTQTSVSDQVLTWENTQRELRKLVCLSLSPREEKAVAAMLMAIRDHYPGVAKRSFQKKLCGHFSHLFGEPEVLKLKRISTSKLSDYL